MCRTSSKNDNRDGRNKDRQKEKKDLDVSFYLITLQQDAEEAQVDLKSLWRKCA